jgi:hypothetical protein
MILTQAPSADVTIALSSSNPNEGIPNVGAVTFTPSNWNTAQTVRVTGQADGVRDGNQAYQLITENAVSSDPAYNGLDVPDVTLTNLDSLRLIARVIVQGSALKTTEDGGAATFTVRLNFRPKSDVTIPIASSNPQEGVTNVDFLVFTPDNFDQPQSVTVTGQADGIKDGNKKFQINIGPLVSADPLYDGMAVAPVQVTNKDSKTLVAGIRVTPTGGLVTDESGGIAPFTVVLTYQPTDTVTIPLSSSNPGEGIRHVGSVSFGPSDWNVPKQILVLGQDDGVFDGDVAYTIITGPAVSADPLYDGINAADVAVRNRARTDAGRFDGIYEGTWTGTVTISGVGKSNVGGLVRAEIRTGIVTVTLPAGGQGTISSTGAVGFGIGAGSVAGAQFRGSIAEENGTANTRAFGTWKLTQPGVLATGRWNTVRVSL